MKIKFTVFFEEPFWVGIAERIDDVECYSAARHVFGPEPTDPEIYQFITECFSSLFFTTQNVKAELHEKKVNPKRLQREIKRSVRENGIQQKAYEAMRLELESRKLEHKTISRARREELELEKYNIKVKKKKEKKKGH
jgi:hypothetical protein